MNKLGAHIIGGWPGNLGKPRLVKLVDCSVEYVAQVRGQIGPQALIIWRRIVPQPLDNPTQRAREWFERWSPSMRAAAAYGPIGYESYNEVADQDAGAYAAFEVERLRLMQAAGLRSVVGNFSVGTPDLGKWAIYKPMLAAMKAGDYLGLHEYWSDQADIGNRWHCARWSLVGGLAGVPIVVTECGRDYTPDTDRGKPGWQHTCNAGEFAEDLRRYNALLEQFSNVVGATVFTVGNDARWAKFDPSAIWPQVVAGYSSPQTYPGVAVPAPAPTTPTPAPEYYQSDRHGYKPEHLVMHDTVGSAKVALDMFTVGSGCKVSAHYLIRTNGTRETLVPEAKAAWHCGGSAIPGVAAGRVNGVSIVNLVSIGIELEHLPDDTTWPAVQVDEAVALAREIVARHGIPRERVWRHADIDSNKRDPRGFPWAEFLDRVYPAPAPLPEHETATDGATLAEKCRWWLEEEQREREAGNTARANEIRLSLIKLLYKLETALKSS